MYSTNVRLTSKKGKSLHMYCKMLHWMFAPRNRQNFLWSTIINQNKDPASRSYCMCAIHNWLQADTLKCFCYCPTNTSYSINCLCSVPLWAHSFHMMIKYSLFINIKMLIKGHVCNFYFIKDYISINLHIRSFRLILNKRNERSQLLLENICNSEYLQVDVLLKKNRL